MTGVRVLPWRGVRLDRPRLLPLEEFVEHDLGYLQPVLRRRALDEHGLRYWPEARVAEDFAFAVLARLRAHLASGTRGILLLSARQVLAQFGPQAVAEQHRAMLPKLLAVPEIAAWPSAVRVLRRHGGRARATLAYRDVQGLTRERGGW